MILLAVAPNGARKTKEDHPAIPLTAEEIGREAKACLDAGAGMIHLHVRNSVGQHSLNIDHYQAAIQEINKQTANKLFIQITSEAVGRYTAEEQFDLIHTLKPDGVSIAIREIHHLDELDINEHFNDMRQNGTFPQLILYNQHDVSTYTDWLQSGLLPGKAYPVLLVIGKAQKEGVFTLESLDENHQLPCSSWMVCAFGEQEYQAGLDARRLGGHIRLGFENNQLLKDGTTADNNAEIVAQMAETLKAQGTTLATGRDAQRIMTPDW